jgi:hypothetical protein
MNWQSLSPQKNLTEVFLLFSRNNWEVFFCMFALRKNASSTRNRLRSQNCIQKSDMFPKTKIPRQAKPASERCDHVNQLRQTSGPANFSKSTFP